jgi:hypothetical protein
MLSIGWKEEDESIRIGKLRSGGLLPIYSNHLAGYLMDLLIEIIDSIDFIV